jgi:hypothetical protein
VSMYFKTPPVRIANSKSLREGDLVMIVGSERLHRFILHPSGATGIILHEDNIVDGDIHQCVWVGSNDLEINNQWDQRTIEALNDTNHS